MLLGCIGDDFTGSSDLANTLAKQGMRTVQYTGIPDHDAAEDVEAGVVALKSRSIPVAEAVAQSLAALAWLQKQGCQQFVFKYCSTFDSTHDGNIGPVADALADALDATCVIVCPAFPGAGRSVYQGHLFVNDVLLNESGMQNHPLTPMNDPDIRRFLAKQTSNPVGHVAASTVFAGAEAITAALARESADGKRLIIVDALRDEDLFAIGKAAKNLQLITGGSGVGMGLPDNFVRQNQIVKNSSSWIGQSGKCVALSGSCSVTTREQVTLHAVSNPAFKIDAVDVIEARVTPVQIAEFLCSGDGIPLAYSSADPQVIADVHEHYGRDRAAVALESFFAEIACLVVANGVTRLISAGGETSGAIVEGLKLNSLKIGPEIAPGVPALRATDNLVLALKSGNFGTADFFANAATILRGD
ncbi:four-carbon acid sugar kinase family protein [Alphaproteobacteria bacterium]|nr:four-carbon acid sugar kinase family protein [Alphaproteobacteria bacterium]